MKVFVFDLLAYGEQLDHLRVDGLLLGQGWPPKQILLCACLGAVVAATATVLVALREPAAPRVLQDV